MLKVDGLVKSPSTLGLPKGQHAIDDHNALHETIGFYPARRI